MYLVRCIFVLIPTKRPRFHPTFSCSSVGGDLSQTFTSLILTPWPPQKDNKSWLSSASVSVLTARNTTESLRWKSLFLRVKHSTRSKKKPSALSQSSPPLSKSSRSSAFLLLPPPFQKRSASLQLRKTKSKRYSLIFSQGF